MLHHCLYLSFEQSFLENKTESIQKALFSDILLPSSQCPLEDLKSNQQFQTLEHL